MLVFYPFAFSEVCTNQLGIYNDLLEDFAEKGAVLYGVSCDATYAQSAFKREMFLTINLALGGTLGGPIAITDWEHAHLDIDYIRWYRPPGANDRQEGAVRLRCAP